MSTKVLYIGGYSRSGSTLLLRLLSSAQDDFVAVGELWDLWSRSFVENQLCGCGTPFRDCEFWNAVMDEAFGGMSNVDVPHMIRLRHAVQSNSKIPLLVVPRLRRAKYRQHLAEYTGVLRSIYSAIDKVSGGRIIVDSSKVPTYAFVLGEISELDLRIVHLIRDSRATAYSWQRKKVRPEIHWTKAYMEQYSPTRSAIEWNIMNGLLLMNSRDRGNYLLVRYEEFVKCPSEIISRIAHLYDDILTRSITIADDNSVQLSVDHTVSGNPNRFENGPVKIVPDEEWRSGMRASQRLLVTTLSFPLLWKYGYLKSQ